MKKTPRYLSEVQSLGPDGVDRLLEITRDVLGRAKALVEHVDRDPQESRLSGIETVGIELSGILEGGKLSSLEDALVDAKETGERPHITVDGFTKLRRAEHLLGEVDLEISRYVESPVGRRAEMGSVHIGQATPPATAPLSTPLLILGVIGAGAILTVIILALVRK